MARRVVVWGTGFVGRMVIPEILRHPAFELVGVGVSNPAKVGKDVGEICGLDPAGLAATDDVQALVDLEPDALVHYGLVILLVLLVARLVLHMRKLDDST